MFFSNYVSLLSTYRYDVQAFLAHRNLEIGDPVILRLLRQFLVDFFVPLSSFFFVNKYFCLVFQEVQVRFAGFEVEEDEWINVKKHVRQRSLPCEASECVAVLAGDLVLCFQVSEFSFSYSLMDIINWFRIYP